MKKRVNWIENHWENWYKLLKTVNISNTFGWKIRPTLYPSISGTKCHRDKPIISAERGDQSDHDEV